MTLESRFSKLGIRLQNCCLNCQWAVIGAVSHRKAEARRGKKRDTRENEFIQTVELRSVCLSLLGRCHCDKYTFIIWEIDRSVCFQIRWVLCLENLSAFLLCGLICKGVWRIPLKFSYIFVCLQIYFICLMVYIFSLHNRFLYTHHLYTGSFISIFNKFSCIHSL